MLVRQFRQQVQDALRVISGSLQECDCGRGRLPLRARLIHARRDMPAGQDARAAIVPQFVRQQAGELRFAIEPEKHSRAQINEPILERDCILSGPPGEAELHRRQAGRVRQAGLDVLQVIGNLRVVDRSVPFFEFSGGGAS